MTQAAPYVFSVELNINKTMWEEAGELFSKLDRDQDCRVVILNAAG